MSKSDDPKSIAGENAGRSACREPVRFLQRLGCGGIGEVFLGEWGGERVAIKRLQQSRLNKHDDPSKLVERFRREARVGMRVQHPSLVAIRELLEQDGELLLVMEYVDGPTLRLAMGERLPFHRALRWAFDVGEGLAALHQAHMIHRDLKPENVLIDRQRQRARVTDYGLVRMLDESTLTSSPRIMGTPGYMAPEQARGKHVDARADLFSFGVLLYELVSGHQPFTGKNHVDVAQKLLYHPHRRLGALAPRAPAALGDLVDQLLEKDPDQRPCNMLEVLRALKRIELSNYQFDVGSFADMDRVLICYPSKTPPSEPSTELILPRPPLGGRPTTG